MKSRLTPCTPAGERHLNSNWLAVVTLAFLLFLGGLPARAADLIPPNITCGDDKFAECGAFWAFDIPTAVDETDGVNVVIQVVSTVTNVASPRCPILFTVTRTWRATDVSGNASFCNQTVTVVDTKPPTINCGEDKTAQCGTSWAFDIPTAVDKCDLNNVIIEVVSTVTNVASPRCPIILAVTRTWRATDTCGNSSFCNQTVTVVDTEPPEIRCGRDKQARIGNPWAFDIPTAVDLCDLNNVLIEVVSTVTNVLSANALSVTRTWRATDTCGNSAFCNQTVTVREQDSLVPLTITSITATPAVLGNNHALVTVTINLSLINATPPLSLQVLSVTSNEPVNNGGDGNTAPDWIIPNPQTNPLTVRLRAERSATGGGRVYTVTVQCTDGASQTALAQVPVYVPK